MLQHIKKENKSCPRIFILLKENIDRVFTDDYPWETGFRTMMKDLPMDWGIDDHRFVIMESLSGVVYGPFIQTLPLRHDEIGMIFVRKEQGVSRTFDVTCHFLMEFVPTVEHPIEYGIPWLEVARILDVPVDGKSFRQIMVRNQDFEKLCRQLKMRNTHPENYMDRVSLHDDFEEEEGS